jgi:two-component system, cell cycle response regulator DivK
MPQSMLLLQAMAARVKGSIVSRARVRPPIVLVVDDFPDNREMYGEYLEHLGFRVLECADGQTALDIARQEKPAAIVMDLSLPVVDGWEATRQLKNDPSTANIMIVVLTGHAEPASRQRAIDAGCDEFMAKPCLPADLAEKIKALLDASATKPTVKTRKR